MHKAVAARLSGGSPPFLLLGALCGAGVFGCSSTEDDRDSQQASGSPNPETVSEGITYYRDVAPILERNCSGCHLEGGAGPYVFKTFEDVAPFAELIAHVTRERIMPPWLADNSGDCRTYEDANWLSEAEITTIANWVDGGLAPGDRRDMPSFERVRAPLKTTHTLSLDTPYVPNAPAGGDDYRCFIVDPELEQAKFITAYQVVPGDPRLVHHVIVYNPDNEAEVAAARQLDAEEEGDGFTCFGGPIVSANVSAAWAPGRSGWSYPAGTGIKLEPGIAQIVQVHYHVHSKPAPDQTQVKFLLVDQVEKELHAWFFANTALSLSAGRSKAVTTLEISPELYLRDGLERPELIRPMTLVGIAPHMHKLGKRERVELTTADGSSTECLVEVPRWDFNWQFMYLFEKPVPLKPDDILRMTCEYDTQSRSEAVYWGEGTSDEMCLSLMLGTFD